MAANNRMNVADLISISEAARLRGVAHATIQDLIGRGKLAAVDVGGRRFLSREEVKSYQPGVPGRPAKNSTAKVSQRKGTLRKATGSNEQQDKKRGRRL